MKLFLNMIWRMVILKRLPGRTTADKELHDKAFNISKNPRYYGYQKGLASMFYTFFNKKDGWWCV